MVEPQLVENVDMSAHVIKQLELNSSYRLALLLQSTLIYQLFLTLLSELYRLCRKQTFQPAILIETNSYTNHNILILCNYHTN